MLEYALVLLTQINHSTGRIINMCNRTGKVICKQVYLCESQHEHLILKVEDRPNVKYDHLYLLATTKPIGEFCFRIFKVNEPWFGVTQSVKEMD